MNNIIAKTYNKHPFVEMEKQNAPWIDSVRTAVNTYVARMEELIKMEAEFEGQPELANDDFLYERFVDNRDGDMFVANWEIFKFFVAKLEIKIAKEVIGEWLYTEHDVEMYRYFHNMKVNINNKCQPKFIKFKSGVDAKLYSVSSAELMQTAKVYYYSEEYKSHDTYFCMMEMFYPLFDCVDNLVKHVKMNQTWNDVDFFEVERYVVPHQVGNAGKFDAMQDVRWQEQSHELPKEEYTVKRVAEDIENFKQYKTEMEIISTYNTPKANVIVHQPIPGSMEYIKGRTEFIEGMKLFYQNLVKNGFNWDKAVKQAREHEKLKKYKSV